MIEEGLVVGYKFYDAAGQLEFEGIVGGTDSLVEIWRREEAEARAAEAAASNSTTDVTTQLHCRCSGGASRLDFGMRDGKGREKEKREED